MTYGYICNYSFLFPNSNNQGGNGFLEKFVHIDLKEYILQNGHSLAEIFFEKVSLFWEIWGRCPVRDGDSGKGISVIGCMIHG